MRTKNTVRNISFALFGQIFGIGISLISRVFFIRFLSADYLGVNGLFTNILFVLSLAELGFSSAMTFSLYKPLAENNVQYISSLMHFYAKIYKIIGICILIIGVCVTPFLKFLIKDAPQISDNLYLIFALYLLNSVISYFYSYKQSLIIADQKKHITTVYRYAFFVLLSVAQMIVLYITHDFILYLVVQIVFTFLENIIVAAKANRMYPYLNEKTTAPLDDESKKEISKNVKALFLHKVGGVASNGITSIFISSLVGIVEVGIYSNYLLIITALNVVFNQIFDSATASVGNLDATSDDQHRYQIFRNILFASVWIFGFSTIALILLFNPFIKLWLGESMLFPSLIVILISVRYFIDGSRRTVLMFRNAMGLFWFDRYKSLIQALVGAGLAILLSRWYGLAGILFGSLLGTIIVTTYIEPYVLFKYGFNRKVSLYFTQLTKYLVIIIIGGIISALLNSLVMGSSWLVLVLRGSICFVVPNLLFILVFHKTKEYLYFISVAKDTYRSILNRKIILK